MKIKLSVKFRNVEEMTIYLFAIIIIFVSGSALTSIDQGKYAGQMLNSILYLIMVYFIIYQIYFSKIQKKIIFLVFLAFLFFILQTINYPTTSFALFKRILLFLLMIFVARYMYIRKINFEKYIYNILIIYSFIALLFFIFINIFQFSIPYIVLKQNTLIYYNYFFMYYTSPIYFISNFIGFSFYRMQGIFWEPGVFAVYLNLALFYYFFIIKKKKTNHLVMIYLCIFATTSTTGICLAIILSGIYFIKKFNKKNQLLIFLPTIFISLLVSIKILISKKNLSNNPWSSYALRTNDLFSSLQIWSKHFFFGTGFNNTSMFNGLITGRANSNGFLTWCYTTGLIGVTVLILPFIGNIVSSKYNRFNHILFLFVFIIINMTEPLISSYFMIYLLAKVYLMFLLLNNKKNKYRKKYEKTIQ